MATLIAGADGNWTDASSWRLCSSAAELDSQAASTQGLTNSYTRTSTFQPGAVEVDAIAVKVCSRTSSPDGTVSVELYNSTNTVQVKEVTIDVADLIALSSYNAGWVVFKFNAAVTLEAGKNYCIGAKISSSIQVNLYRDTTVNNWSRQLRTTTAQAPAASDKLIIAGEHTAAGAMTARSITMNNTADVTYGLAANLATVNVCKGGTLTFGTSESTNYLLKLKSLLAVFPGGTLIIGSEEAPFPASSTATIAFDVTVNVDSGLFVSNYGTFTARGASKVPWTLMTVSKIAGDTVITVADTTGWEAGDDLAFGPTGRTIGEAEKKTISTVDSSTQVTLTGGLSYGHLGVDPQQAEVLNLKRNVKIQGASTSLQAYINSDVGAATTMKYVETMYLGANVASKEGITVSPISTTYAGAKAEITYCSIHEHVVSRSMGINVTGASCTGVTIDHNCFYLVDGYNISLGNISTANTVTNNAIVRSTHISYGYGLYGFDELAVVTGNRISGCAYTAVSGGGGNSLFYSGTFENNNIHSNATVGIALSPSLGIVIKDTAVWNNSTAGITASNSFIGVLFDNCNFFGNGMGISLGSTTPYDCADTTFRSCHFSSSTTFTQTIGIRFPGAAVNVQFESCIFGQATGVYTGHTTGDIDFYNGASVTGHSVFMSNCLLASATQFSNANLRGTIRCQKWGQVSGDNRTFVFHNADYVISLDSAIYHTDAPSERVKVSSNAGSVKMQTGSRKFCVDSGGQKTISAWVRKSASGDTGGADYNGAHPRLMLRRNPAAGITTDQVLGTMTAAVGNWEQLSGTTPAVSEDAVLEVFVDFDGTAGWVNVDDYAVA